MSFIAASHTNRRGRKLFPIMSAVVAAVVVAGCAHSGASAASAAEPAEYPQDTYIAPDVDPNDPVVTSDGDVLGGKPQRRGSTCGDFAGNGPPLAWSGPYSWIGCSYLGFNASATKFYSWYVPWWANGSACTQGLGYNNNSPYWESTGCGSGGTKTLKWGNVVGYPKFKVMDMTGKGTPTFWQ